MEKRMEAQNPPRGAERGHQLGAEEGRAKNIMTWLSRCSILWYTNSHSKLKYGQCRQEKNWTLSSNSNLNRIPLQTDFVNLWYLFSRIYILVRIYKILRHKVCKGIRIWKLKYEERHQSLIKILSVVCLSRVQTNERSGYIKPQPIKSPYFLFDQWDY